MIKRQESTFYSRVQEGLEGKKGLMDGTWGQ